MFSLIGIIQIALSLVIVCGLVTSCAVSPSTSTPGSVTTQSPLNSTLTPTASEYPADISGYVIITDILKARDKSDTLELTPLEGKVFWIVDIVVKNTAYENAVTASYKDWAIVDGDKVYEAPIPFGNISTSSEMSVPVGESGKTTFRFSVPSTLKLHGAELRYQGQEPYSYGKLTGGDRVAVYDWDLKTAIVEQEKPKEYPIETYVIYEGVFTGSYTKNLKTIESWPGNGVAILNFNADKSPLVINYGYTKTSEIKTTFEVYIQSEKGSIYPVIGSNFWDTIMNNGQILEGTGKYRLKVISSGCNWWLKIGVE